MRLFDTHVHLDSQRYARDRHVVLQRAESQGVVAMLNVGFDVDSSRAAVELASEHRRIWAAAGLHPHNASEYSDEVEAQLRLLLRSPRVVALGEIGLDFYRDLSPRSVQRHAFDRLLHLAGELALPVIIHDRDAHEEVFDILCEHDVGSTGGIMHCFSGDVAFARRCLDLGFHISLAGPVTYPRSHVLREVARYVPEQRLLLETDCPYLPPAPHRGKRNEPSMVHLVCEEVAKVRGIAPSHLGEITLTNACRLLGIEHVSPRQSE